MRYKKYRYENGIRLWQCTECTQYLPTESFFCSKRPPGITSRCRKCHGQESIRTRNRDLKNKVNREYMRRARKTNPDKYRLRERLAGQARLGTEKTKAREILNHAVKSGKVRKPTNCSQCGKMRRLTAHHDDYSKPLVVRWLCYECHGNK